MSKPIIFDRERLVALAQELHEGYISGDPFPHVVIDDFLPPDVLDQVLAEFPSPHDVPWWTFDNPKEKKLGTRDDRAMGHTTRQLMAEFNSATMIDFLQSLTGIDGLVPDPHYYGGGLHQIEPGGFLKVHADFNIHPTTGLIRRLNLLVYLNRDWDPSYNGALELWDSNMKSCAQRIEPLYNRCVIFSTTDHSYHGHPTPLSCPEGMTRKSLALYYYSSGNGEGQTQPHNTIFRERPGETIPETKRSASSEPNLRRIGKRWLPPALVDAIKRVRPGRSSRIGPS